MSHPAFAGLDYLDAAVLAVDCDGFIVFANPAANSLFNLRDTDHQTLENCFGLNSPLVFAAHTALEKRISITEHELIVFGVDGEMYVTLDVTPIESPAAELLLEVRRIDQQRRIVNEERLQAQQQANRELIRNLAHEIKNPLGGIRGAAQLLAHELPEPHLKEYTDVIVDEVSRLQSLLDRLLTPHRLPQIKELNIHEVLERVRSLVLAETPNGLSVKRDYDTSMPLLIADKEQLIQSVLNIVRNAIQAMSNIGEVVLRTRIARQVTLNRRRHPLALRIDICDNGPGIPEHLKETIFYPLVSGRDGGTGIGLHLAHTYVAQHHGVIEFDSRPGQTIFSIFLPLNAWQDSGTQP
ncbi:nitrogen regulation protein NR(II) [Deefgea rivuli]|uniref:nitrogen regulation protein NR(II) n=1 Tax=Deefgea rivuli TaxID=400948 RepID=UPI000485EBEC|nr:nitrogen regulation protein NR(II) [Deefgea rivuli]